MTNNPAAAGPSRLPHSAPATVASFSHHSYNHHDADQDHHVNAVPTKAGRKLCVRHKQMANQNVNAKLQKLGGKSTNPQSIDNLQPFDRGDITHLWATFSNASHGKRKLILEGILTMCCFSQLSHLSDQLNEIIRIDPFSLLPREVNLRILGYLDAISLGRAAQVSKSWKALADDDLLWRRMCGQHIDRKCEKCGWGLPLLERRRLKVELKDFSPATAIGVGGHVHEDEAGDEHVHAPSTVLTRSEALGGMNKERSVSFGDHRNQHQSGSGPGGVCDEEEREGGGEASYPTPDSLHQPNSSPRETDASVAGGVDKSKRPRESINVDSSAGRLVKRNKVAGTSDSDEEGRATAMRAAKLGSSALTREVRLTRPWKTVYCERLLVERNWRKGRCTTKALKGHTDGVMCLQYHTTLSSPSHPVLITGSYDRTVRVWNLDTGTELRTLRGHTRAIRTLQFDQMLLFTGSMDGDVRMWNWRSGECLRVLGGHTDGVIGLNYNGYLLATGSADSTINVWNFRNGTKFTLRGHTDWVNSVLLWDGKSNPGDMDPTALPSFSFASLRRTSGSDNSSSSGSAGHGPIPTSTTSTKGSQNNDIEPGTMLFSASDDGTVKLWDLTTRKCIRTFEGHKGQVQSVKLIMVDMTAEEIKKEDMSARVSRALTPPSSTTFTSASQFSNSPPLVAISPQLLDAVNIPDGFDPVAYRSRSREAEVQPQVFLHDNGDGQTKKSAEEKSDAGIKVKKPLLITSSLDGTVKMWNVDTGQERSTLFGHIEGVWAADIDALRIATASDDRTVKVWDRESGNCVQTLAGHRGAVTSLQLSDDMIISGSDDGDVMVWNFAPPPGVTAALPASPAPLLVR